MIITILRKPLEGSVADNTLKHGCGAINIDANRIPTDDQIGRKGLPHHKGPYSNKVVWSSSSTHQIDQTNRTDGRWPANFVLIHKEGCELKGTKKVKSNGHWTQKANIGKFYEGGWSHQEVDEGNKMSDEDGEEEVANWACEEGCPVKEIDQQSGILKSGGRSSKYYADNNSDRSVYTWKGKNGVARELKPSVGGASRFFKQFKKDDQ